MEMQIIKHKLRKLALPAAVSAVGGAIGLFLSRPQKQLRQSLPDDMLERLDSVLGRESQPQQDEGRKSVDTDELEQRLAERRKRREQRKRRLSA
jgi:hypothetical protein